MKIERARYFDEQVVRKHPCIEKKIGVCKFSPLQYIENGNPSVACVTEEKSSDRAKTDCASSGLSCWRTEKRCAMRSLTADSERIDRETRLLTRNWQPLCRVPDGSERGVA